MKFSPQNIFSEFKDNVLEDTYYPQNPIETLKARLTATWLLQHPNPDIVRQAEALIKKSATFKEQDLSRLQEFSSQIKTWDELEICSTYANSAGMFLEYKLSFTTFDERKQTRHFHACYEMKESNCCFVSQTPPLIRVIGDPILQKPGALFPEDFTLEQQKELASQVEHAKSVLIQTSGAGIAANQCAAIERPYRFTIVGVFYDIPEHVAGVERRYPGTRFPQAKIMVNPVITATSKDTQHFNHACLSVPCGNRCAVASPMELSVRYLDPLDDMQIKDNKCTGVDAVVLWHELTHIVFGKTYMDVTFESLSIEDLLQFKDMLIDEIPRRREDGYSYVPELTVPPFHFSVKIHQDGSPKLDPEELAAVLPKMSEETLYGLLNQANELLKK